MKKFFVTYAVTFLPLICYANTFPQGSGLLYKGIAIGIFISVFLAVIGIFIETKISNKKQRIRVEEINIKKNRISENLDLRESNVKLEKQLSGKNEEIESLQSQLSKKEKEIESLRSQIKALSNRNIKPSYDSNKQEDYNEKKDVDENKNTNSNPLVGQLNYIELAVINGNLVKAESEQTTYYRAWMEKGQILFEFVNNDRTRKAINNRTIIIEPFCIKLEHSKSPDVSEEIETITPGILNDDYTLRKKAEIIYK